MDVDATCTGDTHLLRRNPPRPGRSSDGIEPVRDAGAWVPRQTIVIYANVQDEKGRTFVTHDADRRNEILAGMGQCKLTRVDYWLVTMLEPHEPIIDNKLCLKAGLEGL